MTYIVADVHGEFNLFLNMLKTISFSNSDRLIVLGDAIDKGDDSVKLLQYIKSTPNIQMIIGNHEYEFLKHYYAVMKNADATPDNVLKKLKEYFIDGELLDWETVDWLETLPFYIEEKDFIGVHAGVPITSDGKLKPLIEATREQLVYDRTFKDHDVFPITDKCVFFGHTPTFYSTNKDNIILFKKRGSNTKTVRDYCKIQMDTGTWLHGVLGCFCIETLKAYYVKKGQI